MHFLFKADFTYKNSCDKFNILLRSGVDDLLKVEGLYHKFGTQEILKDINFEQEKGTVTTIIGPSGSGKTTLLRSLNMLETPYKGVIELGNCKFDVENYQKQDVTRLRSQSAMVFQHYNLFKNRTILENITEGLIYGQGMKKKAAKEKAMKYLKKVSLDDKADVYPVQLSGGQQQRVGIVRALSIEPEVLLLDEPTSALDPESVQGVLNIIQEIASEGRTMVIVTHEIQFAKEVSDQVVFMDKGEIIESGTPEAVIDNPASERTRRFLSRLTPVGL